MLLDTGDALVQRNDLVEVAFFRFTDGDRRWRLGHGLRLFQLFGFAIW